MTWYFSRREINYVGEKKNCWGGKLSKCFSPGSDFTEQIFTGELVGMDSAGVLRQDVVLQKSLKTQVGSNKMVNSVVYHPYPSRLASILHPSVLL